MKIQIITMITLIGLKSLSGQISVTDNFDDGDLNATLWALSGSEDTGNSFVESGGVLSFVVPESLGLGDSEFLKLSYKDFLPYRNFSVSFDMENLIPGNPENYPEFSFGVAGYDVSGGKVNVADFATGLIPGGSFYYSSWLWAGGGGELQAMEALSESSVHVDISFSSSTDVLRTVVSDLSGPILVNSICIGSDTPDGMAGMDWGLGSTDQLGLYFLVYSEGPGTVASDITLDNFELTTVPEPKYATALISSLILIFIGIRRFRTSRWR